MNFNKFFVQRRKSAGLSSMLATVVLLTGAITLGFAIYTVLFGVI